MGFFHTNTYFANIKQVLSSTGMEDVPEHLANFGDCQKLSEIHHGGKVEIRHVIQIWICLLRRT